MRTGILTILAYFVMCSVSYASDVYITQSGASLTANINQDGQTNKFGDDTTELFIFVMYKPVSQMSIYLA